MTKEKISNNQLYGFLPADVDDTETLIRLAIDLRWSWNHAADELWRQLDAELWEITHNPWIMLQTVSRDRLKQQLADDGSDLCWRAGQCSRRPIEICLRPGSSRGCCGTALPARIFSAEN